MGKTRAGRRYHQFIALDSASSSSSSSDYKEDSDDEDEHYDGSDDDHDQRLLQVNSDSSSSEDESEEEQPAPKTQTKKRAVKKASTTKSTSTSSTSTVRQPTSKSSSKVQKAAQITPRNLSNNVTIGTQQRISPISDDLNNAKIQRRAESIAAMGTKKRNHEEEEGRRRSNKGKQHKKSKRSSKEDTDDEEDEDLRLDNKKQRAEIKKLAAELAAAQQQAIIAELPTPDARRSTKKGRRATKKKTAKGVSMDKFVKDAAKAQFHHVKFVKNDAQFRLLVGNIVMDVMEMPELLHKAGESEEVKRNVDLARERFYHEWGHIMATGFNEERNYRQGRVKDACLEWMKNNRSPVLFPTEDLEIVMKRDLSEWEPKIDEHGAEIKTGDPARLKYLQGLMDLYVDKLLPAVAGCHTFSPAIRHFIPVSEAKFPDGTENVGGQLMILPGTEALVLLFVKNARKKWEMMYDWEVVQGKTDKRKQPFPKYSPKKPTVNPLWKTEYSNTASGQNPFKGWSSAGLKEYSRILKFMKAVRSDKEMCLEYENACMLRLYRENKDTYEKEGEANHRVESDDDDDFDLELENPDDEY